MKLDGHIDDLIQKEKQVKPNPFLSTRIMAKLDEEMSPDARRIKIPTFQMLALAASMAFIVMMGIGIGSIGEPSNDLISININDSQMENLNLYILSEYE